MIVFLSDNGAEARDPPPRPGTPPVAYEEMGGPKGYVNYGAGWAHGLMLSTIAWGFVYGVFEKILHVPWPTPLIQSLF